jgi:Chaperone of endosialidase
MSEVTTWNATDNANTAAPPDGWPEGQQPSSVNDCGRMMMGALRREHDRITAQIGSVAGTINTTTINATTISTTGAITASGPITGTALNSSGNASVAGTLTAQNLSVTSNAVVNGNATVNGVLTAQNLNVSSNVIVYGAQHIYMNLSVDGTTYTHNVLAYSDNAASVGLLGAAYSGMSAYGFTTVSDQQVKGDIQPLPPGSLDLVQTIMPHTYKLLTGPDQETRHAGFIAQEVGQALQSSGQVGGYVLDKESGIAGLAYNELVAVLWGAVQELTQQVEALKREKADV